MDLEKIRYPAKVMLAGEYGVVLGGSAITIPFESFETWPRYMSKAGSSEKEAATASSKSLQKIFAFLETLPAGSFHARFNKNLFAEHLCEIWYESTIPDGYGIGSSGALTACLYRQFFENTDLLTLQQQRHDLGLIESYFHGKSSGVDALTCFRKTSLFFREDGGIEEVSLDMSNLPMGYRFFLLDSHTKFQTGPLVEMFLERIKDKDFEAVVREEYLPMNQKFIESLLGMRDANPGLLLRVISDFQFTYFRKMIPDSMLDIWIDGQVGNDFYIKLNGSGGGYMLGICHYTAADSLKNRFGNDLLWIK